MAVCAVLCGADVAAEPVTVRDALNRSVVVDDTSRIVSIGGAVTEILYALGKDSDMVAVDIDEPVPGTRHRRGKRTSAICASSRQRACSVWRPR